MAAFFDGDEIPGDVKRDLISFARPPAVLGVRPAPEPNREPSPLLPPAGFIALPYKDGVLFHWERAGGPDTVYRVCVTSRPGGAETRFTTSGATLFVPSSHLDPTGSTAGYYVGAVEALRADGRASIRSPEIRFDMTPIVESGPDIPNEFKAKVVWANVSAWLKRSLL